MKISNFLFVNKVGSVDGESGNRWRGTGGECQLLGRWFCVQPSQKFFVCVIEFQVISDPRAFPQGSSTLAKVDPVSGMVSSNEGGPGLPRIASTNSGDLSTEENPNLSDVFDEDIEVDDRPQWFCGFDLLLLSEPKLKGVLLLFAQPCHFSPQSRGGLSGLFCRSYKFQIRSDLNVPEPTASNFCVHLQLQFCFRAFACFFLDPSSLYCTREICIGELGLVFSRCLLAINIFQTITNDVRTLLDATADFGRCWLLNDELGILFYLHCTGEVRTFHHREETVSYENRKLPGNTVSTNYMGLYGGGLWMGRETKHILTCGSVTVGKIQSELQSSGVVEEISPLLCIG